MNIIKKIIMTILPVMLVFMGTASVVYAAPRAELTSFADLSGKTVSMLTGAPFEELVRSKNQEVGEFTSFNNTPDMLLALEAGKTDAALTNNAIAALAVNRNQKLALFPREELSVLHLPRAIPAAVSGRQPLMLFRMKI